MRFSVKPVYINILLILFLCSCAGTQAKDGNNENNDIEDKEYNFRFIGYDINIDDPGNDRRSYYKIKIDKIEVGRTTIGLESQEKIFEYTLSNNRHLLMVEKWALDMKKGKYIKLNNIEQPTPTHKYFTLPNGGIVKVTLENDPINRESNYFIELE